MNEDTPSAPTPPASNPQKVIIPIVVVLFIALAGSDSLERIER
jgi:hypothetical protein